MPRVTIGIPVRNGERFLAEQLDSLLAQTYPDFVIHIADNASTDATEEIAREYVRRDERVAYDRHEVNRGAAFNVNHLIRSCATPYFKLAAHDDLHAETYLEKCVPPLENDQGVVLCHSLTTIVDENGAPFETVDDGTAVVDFAGRRWPIDPLDRRLDSDRPSVRYHDIIHHTVLVGEIWGVMRHSALLRTALFGRYFGSDRPMMAELALMGRFVTIPEPLFSLRVHGTHTTRQGWRERGERVDPDAPAAIMRFSGLQTFRDFGRAIAKADLSRSERARAIRSWLALPVNPRVVRKFLVPGPFNYFGIDMPRWWTRQSRSSGTDNGLAVEPGDAVGSGPERATVKDVEQRRWSRIATAVTPGGDRRFLKQHLTDTGELLPSHLETEVTTNRVLGEHLDEVSVPRICAVDDRRCVVSYEWLPVEPPDRLIRDDPNLFRQHWREVTEILPCAVDELRAAATALPDLPARYVVDDEDATMIGFEGLEIRNLAVVGASGDRRLVMFDTGELYRTSVDHVVSRLVVSAALLNWGRPLRRFVLGPPSAETLQLAEALPGVAEQVLLAELESASRRHLEGARRGGRWNRAVSMGRSAVAALYLARARRTLRRCGVAAQSAASASANGRG